MNSDSHCDHLCECHCSFSFILNFEYRPVIRNESEIFYSDKYEFKCSLCGHDTQGNDILYAWISDHYHPGDVGLPVERTYNIDGCCDCGHCCGCFMQEETDYDLTPITGYVCIICTTCGNNQSIKDSRILMNFRQFVLNKYCILCLYSREASCSNCGITIPINYRNNYRQDCNCGGTLLIENNTLSQIFL